MTIVVIVIVIIYLLSLFEKWINRKLPKYEDVTETKGANVFKNVGLVLVVAILLGGYFLGDVTNAKWVMWVMVVFIALMWGFQAFMEKKYLESNKYKNTLVVMAVGIVLTVGAFYVYEERTHTTYGELMESYGDIQEINISKYDLDEKEGYWRESVTVTDKAFIERFVEVPAHMDLRKRDVRPGINYWITIQTDSSIIEMTFSEGEQFIRISGAHYLIDGENKILEVIENAELEWQEGL